jgi:serine protease Do
VAARFVRVRLPRIDREDLNLFEFDYDLTFMVFFMNAEGKVYARYGGRDAKSPDSRQSLEGLRYTMESVLAMHEQPTPAFAPRSSDAPQYLRELTEVRRGGRCLHCHQVKETLYRDLQRKGQWSRELAWRYPLPENVGLELDLDRGNVVKQVRPASPAAALALEPGDILRWLNGVPIHSLADVQFALDHAPRAGDIEIAWERQRHAANGRLRLTDGWRKTDISWRPSLQDMIPAARLYGTDLSGTEKRALGLGPRQLAFRQRDPVSVAAATAGIRGGDIILGFDDQKLEMDVDDFLRHVERNYFAGERVMVNVLREGQRLDLPMILQR